MGLPPLFKLKKSGFTLLELLVVLVIMGILFSFAALSLNSRPAPTKQAAYQLQQLLNLALDDAVLRGQIMGWSLHDSEHYFSRYKDNQWLPLSSDNLLRHYRLNKALDYQLEIDGLPADTTQTTLPQILLLPDGSISQFNLTIKLKNSQELEEDGYKLYSDYNSIKLSLLSDDPT